MGGSKNPRWANGTLRRKYRARMKAQGGECGICKGRLGPIHYDEPSNFMYPYSFVIDEIIPVSRWKEFGYPSPEAVAQDWNNLQPAHYICNEKKSNNISLWAAHNGKDNNKKLVRLPIKLDGEW